MDPLYSRARQTPWVKAISCAPIDWRDMLESGGLRHCSWTSAKAEAITSSTSAASCASPCFTKMSKAILEG